MSKENVYLIGNKEFNFNTPCIMGILNVTPDSFSDGGKYLNKDDAVKHALNMLNDGADIIDIGGESTRPGSDPVSADEESNRVLPVIKEILKNRPEAILSIDTNKSIVARKALENGVQIINDISGLTFDPEIASAAVEYNAALVIMHIKGTPKTMQLKPDYKNLINEIYEFLYDQTNKAVKAGVKKIIVDPGIGFGKTAEDNLVLIKKLSDFKSLGYPILIGVSRKSFLGKIAELEVSERDNLTSVAETLAVLNGANIIRTHNVKNCANLCKLLTTFSAA
jgi:dihydropteroate synthase